MSEHYLGGKPIILPDILYDISNRGDWGLEETNDFLRFLIFEAGGIDELLDGDLHPWTYGLIVDPAIQILWGQYRAFRRDPIQYGYWSGAGREIEKKLGIE